MALVEEDIAMFEQSGACVTINGKVTCGSVPVSSLDACCVPWEFSRWFKNGFILPWAGSKTIVCNCRGGSNAGGLEGSTRYGWLDPWLVEVVTLEDVMA
ncbi:uncharacterized protein G2W53_021906 [Senna tora]|uniref:Uncharacterized protein n=1 Tax=Senna tora TaxID=362788 RepID=A0A834WIB0_9FABA|nr:uncharacterized protein G2W53_021906 [Senna tora]